MVLSMELLRYPVRLCRPPFSVCSCFFFFFFFVGGRLVTARTRAVRREFLLRSKNGICFGRIDDSQVQSLAWMAIWYKIDAKFNNEHGLLWRSDW